eukprot:512359_1
MAAIWLFILNIQFALSECTIVYVAQAGMDKEGCGKSVSSACGTFYFASIRANGIDSLFIHDGQNENEIYKYLNANKSSIYHPCLPLPYIYSSGSYHYHSITISFNTSHIHNMEDWFMKGVCYDNNKTIKYINTHLFHIETLVNDITDISFSHLYVDNFSTSIIPFGIFYIRHVGSGSAIYVSCDKCIFQNVNYTLNIPMIYISGDENTQLFYLFMSNSTFAHINASSQLIKSVMSQHGISIQMHNVSTVNCTFNKSMIESSYQASTTNAANSDADPPTFSRIVISECNFMNIQTQESIIGAHYLSFVKISNSNFQNILRGCIIQSTTAFLASDEGLTINIKNIFVSTSQTIERNPTVIFNFDSHTTATIKNIKVIYYYDLSINCNYDSHPLIECHNPVPLMYNKGYVTIDSNNSFDVHTIGNISNTTHFVYSREVAFIMTINSIMLGNIIFWSYGNLNLHHVIIPATALKLYMLQPSYIISHVAKNLYIDYTLYIDQCRLMGGSRYIINIEYSNMARITNTVFEAANKVIYAIGVHNFVMQNSRFYRIGPSYTFHHQSVGNAQPCPVFIWSAQNVSISNNIFSYYPQYGFAKFLAVRYLLLQNNLFIVNYTSYKSHTSHISISNSESIINGAIDLQQNWGLSTVINNHFLDNDVTSMHVPWLYYFQNSGVHCLSGNEMNNFALHLVQTNLTSCTRPQLINCLTNDDHCEDGMYGLINNNIYNMKSVFTTTKETTAPVVIWQLDTHSYMSLDNVEIQNASIAITQGNVFLLDSYLLSNDLSTDIWYLNSTCFVICNDRMANNTKQIAKFVIRCNTNLLVNRSVVSLVKSMSSHSTNLVNHFSAKMLHFNVKNTSYWPGSILYFDYSIADIFGNIIDFTTIVGSSIAIIVQNSNLSLLIQFNIDEYGVCGYCKAGITIFRANLVDKFGGPYKVSIHLDYDYLLLENKDIYLYIVGCPIGYGATTNKQQCEKCASAQYNIKSNNTNTCLRCDDKRKKISQCDEYFHSLHTEYLYLLFLLVIPLIIIFLIAVYCKRQYDKAFVVSKSLVLIIGISQFDDKQQFLPGVMQSVVKLVELWRDKYNYEVIVCNKDTLYSTKQDVHEFIDQYLNKINEGKYECVIVHIISHGTEEAFIASDGKEVYIDFISHELSWGNSNLIKLIVNHGCRGQYNYSDNSSITTTTQIRGKNKNVQTKASFNISESINNKNQTENISDQSNLIIISDNVKGRTMSDSGTFTECICDSFAKNLNRKMKATLQSQLVEIGNNLEKKTNCAEVCNISGTLRFNPIRFQKCKDKQTYKVAQTFGDDCYYPL